MKYTEWLGSGSVKCLAMLVLAAAATSLTAAEDHQGWAKVRFAVGSPTYSKPGGTDQKLEKQMVLHAGDTIKCDQSSHADLILGYNNGSIQVSPDSILKLDVLSYRFSGVEVIHDTQLDLQRGVLYGQVNKMAKESKYEVKTKNGVAGIKGTRYRISAEGDVTVTEGTVVIAIKQADGSYKTFTIHRNETLIASTGVVRPATEQEIREVNQGTSDAMSHGGFVNNQDPETRQFFKEAVDQPYVSPIQPN